MLIDALDTVNLVAMKECWGKLNRERLYSDEITVVFEPEKIAMAQTPMYESMDRFGCASSDLSDRFGCAVSNLCISQNCVS